MAYIANTMFSQRATNAAHDDLANIPGKFQASGQDEICSAGFLCVRSTQILPKLTAPIMCSTRTLGL